LCVDRRSVESERLQGNLYLAWRPLVETSPFGPGELVPASLPYREYGFYVVFELALDAYDLDADSDGGLVGLAVHGGGRADAGGREEHGAKAV
jgi:hypothetical protein